ncbi:hypothetical protein DFH28DRAFT_324612 [Melampsora americana]|nr:hypothetical protein DFH28DRAFT_324612 [Melampsora americana]
MIMFYAGHSPNPNSSNSLSNHPFNSLQHSLLILIISLFTFSSSSQFNYQSHTLSHLNQQTEWERERGFESEFESDLQSNHPLRSIQPNFNVLLSIADPSAVSNHAGQVLGNTPQVGSFFSNPTPIITPSSPIPNHIPTPSIAPITTTPIHTPLNPINPSPIPTSTSAILPLHPQPLLSNTPEAILPTSLGSVNPIPVNGFVPSPQLQSAPSIEGSLHHPSDSNETLLSTGAIIGIVIGLILIISLLPLLCLYFHRKKQKKLINHESFFNNPIITSTLVPNQRTSTSNQVGEYHFRGTPYPLGIEEHDYPKINHLNSPRRFDRFHRTSPQTSFSRFHHELHPTHQNGRIDEDLPIPLQLTDHSVQPTETPFRKPNQHPNPSDFTISVEIPNHRNQEEFFIESIDPPLQEELQNREEDHLPLFMEVDQHNEQEEIVIEDCVPVSMRISIDRPQEEEEEEEEGLDHRSSAYGLGNPYFNPDETMRFPSDLDLQLPEEVVIRDGPQMDATFSTRPSSVQRIVSQVASRVDHFEERNPFKRVDPTSVSSSHLCQSSLISEDEILNQIDQTLKDIQIPKESFKPSKEISMRVQPIQGSNQIKLERSGESIRRTEFTTLGKNRYLPRNLPKRNQLPIRRLNAKNLNQNQNQNRNQNQTQTQDLNEKDEGIKNRLTHFTNESFDVPDPFVKMGQKV